MKDGKWLRIPDRKRLVHEFSICPKGLALSVTLAAYDKADAMGAEPSFAAMLMKRSSSAAAKILTFPGLTTWEMFIAMSSLGYSYRVNIKKHMFKWLWKRESFDSGDYAYTQRLTASAAIVEFAMPIIFGNIDNFPGGWDSIQRGSLMCIKESVNLQGAQSSFSIDTFQKAYDRLLPELSKACQDVKLSFDDFNGILALPMYAGREGKEESAARKPVSEVPADMPEIVWNTNTVNNEQGNETHLQTSTSPVPGASELQVEGGDQGD